MTCRAPSNTVTYTGTPTGAAMTYDAERRLATWQNTPSNPTSTASYWYDGEGNRVAQTYNGTTTYYLGDDEEITGSTLLKYYHIPNLPVLGTIVGVTRTYLASDGLGSESVDLSYNGSVLATSLYGPYGVGRYATGTMPSSKGYTGQRQDSGSGLDYYNARYYDASVGQFTSADTVQGSNRYGYVGGNPETATDASGKSLVQNDGVGGNTPDEPNWPDYGPYIDAHRGDSTFSFPIVLDNRTYGGGFSLKVLGIGLSREEKQEYTDAEVLKNYFGLTVEIRDTNEKRAEGKHPRRSDYVIGLAETDGFPLWSMSVEAGTNADLYYPKAGTSMGTIDGHVRDKAATQGGLVVLDMSESQQLQASYQAWVKASDEGSAHSWDQIDNFMSPFRVGTAPDRVIVIDHGDVVYDTYSYNMQWGPEPNLA